MLHNFFAAPDFIALLRFWDRVRAASGVAVWDGDFAIVPAELLPNLIVAAWSPVPVYRYVGRECADRFGADPTGLPVLETLGGAYGRYIRTLGDEVMERRARRSPPPARPARAGRARSRPARAAPPAPPRARPRPRARGGALPPAPPHPH